jgi:hypothetical protein
MCRSIIGGLAVVMLLALSAAADDAVIIKDFVPKTGQRFKVTIAEKNNAKTAFTIMGNAQNKEEMKTKSVVYTEEVLENSGNNKAANKLKRIYEKAVTGKDGKDTKMALDGKTIVIEKKGDKYAFTEDGNDLTGEARTILDSEFNNGDLKNKGDFFLPKNPVKVGESWKIYTADIQKMIAPSGGTLDKDKTTMKGTLIKVYKKDQEQFGIMELVLDSPITGLGPMTPLVIKDAKLTMKITADICINGSIPDGTMTNKYKSVINGTVMGIDLKIESDSTENRKQELLK